MFCTLGIVYFSCKKDPQISQSGFPRVIENIFIKKCATAGCHNDKSFSYAANLNLSTWENLFYKGGSSGAVIIPFRADYSSLYQFCNTYEDLGLTAQPSMPLNAEKLSRDEINTLYNWIQEGCPNDKGEIPFEQNMLQRKKVFVSNQSCDVISVLDVKSKLVMRLVDVGNKKNEIEIPHNLVLSPDGRSFYTCFINNNILQKYSVLNFQLEGEANLGVQGAWNVVKTNSNGQYAYISDLSSSGAIAKVNTNTMTISQVYQSAGLFINPHGIAVKGLGDTIYVCAQYGNFIYRFIPALFSNTQITMVKGQLPNATPDSYDPHEIVFSPDGKKYFISCQASNEVRVFDATQDTLLKVISVGKFPLEFAMHKTRNLLFVSCQEEPNIAFPNLKGAVEIIDMNTLNSLGKIYGKMYQPHAVVVNETNDELWVFTRNIESNGPAPHHSSACGGRNGYFEVFDINTKQKLSGAKELGSDPYAAIISQ